MRVNISKRCIHMSIFDFEALATTPVERDPFDYIVVPDFVRTDAMKAINRDYPDIDSPRNLDPEDLEFGPAFQGLLDELNKPKFSRALGEKFGVDLSNAPSTITVRKYCEESDGNIHTDHWSKIITVLIYFNEGWPHEGGQLRMLRSDKDVEDFANEVKPLAGTLLAFRRSDHSYHGHRRFVGERRMLQMNWIRPNKMAQSFQKLARFSTHAAKRLAQMGR